MYDSGLRDLDFAIESGSKDVLKEVQKANKPQDMIKSIRNALDVGMNLSANFILGLPKEGYLGVLKSYFLSMRLAVAGLQEINVFPFIPYPGSELFYSLCREDRLKLDDSFFFKLFGYADLTTAISWSDHYSPRMLRFMRLFVMSSFYSLMFLTLPQKFFHLVRNLITGKTNAKSTKIEGVLRRIYLGMKTYNKSTSASQ